MIHDSKELPTPATTPRWSSKRDKTLMWTLSPGDTLMWTPDDKGVNVLISSAIANAATRVTGSPAVVSLRVVKRRGGGEKRIYSFVPSATPSSVPQWPETFLLLVLSRKQRQEVPGDLEEDFQKNVVDRGLRMARYLYLRDVAVIAIQGLPRIVRYGIVAWIARKLGG